MASLPLKKNTRSGAFTLIELLVVVAIISLLAGAIGIALKGGDASSAMRAAQSTVFSMVASARGQAILNQGTARLLVYADVSDADKNLHYLQVVSTPDSTPSASSVWTATGDGVTLPTGVFVVPPTGMSATSTYAHVSALSTATSFTVSGVSIPKVYYVEFGQLGTPTELSTGVYGTIVLSTADPDPTSSPALQPKFNNPANIRGLLLRKLGSSTLLNSDDDF